MSAADEKLDKKLDGWLADWPVAERPEQSWDEMAAKIATRTSRTSPGTAEAAWLEAPCPLQPDEGTLDDARPSGGRKMADETDDKPKSEEATASAAEPAPAPAEAAPAPEPASAPAAEAAPAPAGRASIPSVPPEDGKPKKSLKDIAKRISIPPPPMPAADSAPAAASAASTRTPLPVTKRPVEAKDGDSGVVNLQAVREQAASIPDTGAQPGQSGLFDDDEKRPAAAAAAARPAAKKSSLTPLIAGSVVALGAIAAVAVLALRTPKDQSAPASAPMAAASATATASATPQELASATPQPGEAPAAAASGANPTGGPIARNDEGKGAPGEPKAAAAKPEDSKDKAAPAATGDPNSLQAQMDKAVGGSTAAPGKAEAPASKTPASADVPEVPSQGAIQGAMGAVMGSARACVAGMDEPSRAQVTFVSNGSVSAVSVSGPAAGKPAAGCITSALKRAKVTPFQKPSFSVGVTIRP